MAKTTLREQQRETTIEAIKALARAQMQANGTAGISLRGIARDLGVTAPALYRYFADRDDLITDLLLDAFNAVADTMIAAETVPPRDHYAERLTAVMLAYRRWALQYPTDFQLIYGNPIPGYVAPAEITVPAAARAFVPVVAVLSEASLAGVLVPPMRAEELPPVILAHIQQLIVAYSYPPLPVVLYLATLGWERIHGMVTLELFEQTEPLVGDTEAHYRYEVARLCAEMNLFPKT